MNDNINKQVNYWKKSSERSWETASGLFKIKRYDACLFFCHLTLEKSLKGLFIKKTKNLAPYIHDLAKLSNLAQLNLPPDQIQNLRIITTFNISTRYDDIKFEFYKKCTKKYTEKYFLITKKLFLWLKKQYPKK